ncbi:hypothetical protein ACEQPO_17200 [Bacillus sp. SL00103]
MKTEEFVPVMFELWNELKKKCFLVLKQESLRCEEDDILQGIVSMIAVFYWIKGERIQTLKWEHIKQGTFSPLPLLIGQNV